jgi:membrane-associated phospholipid phosphatase
MAEAGAESESSSSQRPSNRAKPISVAAPEEATSRARTIAFHILLPLVACGQLWALIELTGIRLSSPPLVFAMEGLCIAGSVYYGLRTKPRESRELGPWWAIGLVVFVVWAILYFTAAHVTEPMKARTFSDSILERLPMKPELAAVYLGVHVFGLIPFCVLPELRLLRRHLLGAVLIVGLSAIAWVALPVRLDRPPIPTDDTSFGAWLLRGVHGFDPTTNCFPSAHCAIAVYAAIGLRFGRSLRLFIWGIFTAILICVSTVLTRQHYVADVASGALLAAIAAYMTQRKTRSIPFDR